jgi:hypothetical protein
MWVDMGDAEVQRQHVLIQRKREALLRSYLEQLRDLAPPAAATAADQYRFHSEIERVSGQLYRDGHYKQAALEAYIRVINSVLIIPIAPRNRRVTPICVSSVFRVSGVLKNEQLTFFQSAERVRIPLPPPNYLAVFAPS